MVFSTLSEIKRETRNSRDASVSNVNYLIKFIEEIMKIMIQPLNVLRVMKKRYIIKFTFYFIFNKIFKLKLINF